MKKFRLVFCFLGLLLLSGCKVQLYTGLTEKEGNDMLAILLDNSIPAEKTMDKDGNVTLTIATDDVSRAIRLLRSNGYPKDRFSSVSDIFPKDSLISSPVEEKARYTYSMSQELSATLSMIDGVLTARVHVVLPQDQGAGHEDTFPSSASVFIKYTPELELAGFIPKVKTLVANSIEGLSLDKITVSLFPSSQASGDSVMLPQELETVLSIDVTPESSSRLLLMFGALLVLFLFSLAGSAVLFWLWWQSRKSMAGGMDDDMDVDTVEVDNVEAG
ncbi:type III secretion inner membrane ring lipoprotein SctJ [Sansalvadorimonas sp. 2012CJ34-2]|uniref:Lipoprotein n=1 Tax=Parendozoicomonas callyspongiae TaxID=2942213 RepID=A0ABT0PGP5_9GAMM|nr:type III secretion inner membrane ring lipoprotein SctJ [Sansalvadorimonas sp. 2012CJ34-2]MCL6270558.1 type III secretion inner membrane ring lipoprotein SctJ [Sansalvadorimonas sp. 2012CJ34-2]